MPPQFVKFAAFAANHRNWNGLMPRDYIDRAIVQAYTENVGHEPPPPQPSGDAWEQWTYSPHSKGGRAYARRLMREANHPARKTHHDRRNHP